MTTHELRQKYLDFFKEKGHAIIPSSSLLPENDPTVLFTTAGMHPLVPYLMGQAHPLGKRLTSVQKCVRTDDIEEVGDNRHLTFFEMLGNWSLGDYFKEEAIGWSFEFLTSKDWLGINVQNIYVSIFEGDDDAARDDESVRIWQSQFEVHGIAANLGQVNKDEPAKGLVGPRIYSYPKKSNWWGPAGITGPCGPDTEIFFDTGKEHDPLFGQICHPNCDCGRFVEIWNVVFMQYEKKFDGSYAVLAQKNVDTGMGLERTVAMLQNKDNVFETQPFQVIFSAIHALCGKNYGSSALIGKSYRIIADHVRSATFIIGDQRGVVPSNVGQGYIVRRLLRRAMREGRRLGITEQFLSRIASIVIGEYGFFYSELEVNSQKIITEIKKEEEKFAATLEKGLKEFEKMMTDHAIDGKEAFDLFQTFGFPLELTEELVKERGGKVDIEAFKTEFKKHQELSRTASAGVFKGGLADNTIEVTRLHTATHLLHRALKEVLGDHVAQRGSNINAERLRFDFTHGQKMTADELARVEEIVNQAILNDFCVKKDEMSPEEARKNGAIGLFEQKYGDKVSVYTIGDFSKEICGGPHVFRTGELGSFKIIKEEAVSAGVRRIKAAVTGPVEV